MKNLIILILSVFFLICLSNSSRAQVTLTGTSPTIAENSTYSTLSAAFSAINGFASWSGKAIVITVTSDVYETVSAQLNQPATNNWTSLTIKPNGARVISGSISGGGLIFLNGADNVTIDGLNTDVNSLVISNTNSSVSSGTSTILFKADASSNKVTNCTVLGSFSGSASATGGNILFFTGTTSGNDNNEISYCNIGPAGTYLPSKAIYGNGTTSNTLIGNSGITITNNNIYDYFAAASTSAGIYLGSGNNNWSITNNNFYQTGTRTWGTGAQHTAIWINSNTAVSGAQGFTITGNKIGYASSTQTGTYTLTGSGTGAKFCGIYYSGISAANSGSSTSISNNTISSVSLSGVTSSGITSAAPFVGIAIASGSVSSNANTIGSQSTTGALLYATNSSLPSNIIGLYNYSADIWTGNNNLVGGISVANSSSGAVNIYGIYESSTANTVSATLQSNVIGGSIANSIQNSTGGLVYGLYDALGIGTISENTIHNLSGSGNLSGIVNSNTSASDIYNNSISDLSSSGASALLYGIYNTAGTNLNIYGNIINAISGTGAISPLAAGIFINSGTSVAVYKNKIYDIQESGAVSSSIAVSGLHLAGGTTVAAHNNLIGDLKAPNAVFSNSVIGIGVVSTTASSNYNLYHNTIYLSGSGGANFGSSGIYHAASATSTMAALDLRNNIIVNNCTPSGTGATVAFRRSSGSSGSLANYSASSNNNLFFAGTPSSSSLIYSDGTSTAQTLSEYRNGAFNAGTIASRDGLSITENPSFLSTSGSSADFLHLDASVFTSINGGGNASTGINVDFDSNNRDGSAPDIGGDEFAGTCLAPQPTNLSLTPSGSNINGNFTASNPGANAYLVVRTSTNTAPTPINGTSYTVGSTDLGSETYVESVGNITSFVSEVGLVAANTYYYWVFSMGNFCATTPIYAIMNPLSGSSVAPSLCSTPLNQPTNLILTATGGTTISGVFSAPSTPASGYLVVRSASYEVPIPVNGVQYSVGSSSFGAGTYIESVGASTSFGSTALDLGTTYYYFVFAYNSSCTGQPYYLSETSTPSATALTGSMATLSCPSPGTYSVGPTGDYSSITNVINTLSAGCALTGAYIFELQSSYNASVEIFPLSIPLFSGSSETNTVTFRPESGATGLIIGSSNSTGTLIFSQAANIFFDGRSGGTGTAKNLTIQNTHMGASFAIQIINDAKGNTIEYCNIRSANNSTASGTIVFGTSLPVTGIGNENNTITYNDIFDASTGSPANAIFSLGSNFPYDNRANNVTYNNIFNFFSEGSDMNGVFLSSGNSDWVISNNSFFETSPKNLLGASNVWSAVQISSNTVNNSTVSQNYIGGQSSNATGNPLTLTGSGVIRAMRFIAGANSPTDIQGNYIKNISFSTSSSSTNQQLIALTTGSFNCGNVSANNIGDQGITNSIVISSSYALGTTYFRAISIGAGTPAAINVSNNLIGGIECGGGGTMQVHLIGIQTAATSLIVSNNMIGSTSTANSISTSSNQAIYGIYSAATLASQNILSNTIANIVHSNAGTASSLFGIYAAGNAGGSFSITGNTIHHLSTSCTSTSLSLAGVYLTAATTSGQSISQNMIYTLSNSTSTSTAVMVAGIYYNGPGSGTNVVSRNAVHTLSCSSASPSTRIYGLYAAGGVANYHNNMIRLGTDNTTVGYAVFGVFEAAGSNNFYFNSIYIGGTGIPSGASATYSFYSAVSSGTRNYEDNIFFNARSNASAGAGKNYAYRLESISGLTSDYNDIYANGTDGVFGYFTADVANITAWQTATSSDLNSKSFDPQFIDATGTASTVDLHIHPTNPTVIENVAGASAANSDVSIDFDGQMRSGLTPTDIGADAGNFVKYNAAAPVISYSSLAAVCGLVNRTVSANISDVTGIPTSGALMPRIYYRKAAGLWYSSPGSLTSGTSFNGNWSFTIVANDIAGLVSGDEIQYYIIAQNNFTSPGIASNPSTGLMCTDVNTVSAPPTQPNSFLMYETPTANAGSSQTACGSNPSFTLNGTIGGAASSASWSGGAGVFTPNNSSLNAVYTPTALEIAAGAATLTLATNDPSGPCGSVVSNVILNIGSFTWSGASSAVWTDPANWNACGVPASGADITIATTGTNPILPGNITLGSLQLTSGTTLSISGYTLTINGSITGSGKLIGSSASSLVIGGAAGSIGFDQANSENRSLKNLTLSASATATLGNNLEMAAAQGTLIVHSGATLTTSGLLTLKSNISGSATVGNSAGIITGNVTVERYIPNNGFRSWRLLSVPTYGSQTINAAWQEGNAPMGNNTPGFGTLLTGTTTALGFDDISTYPGMLSYNGSNFVGIPRTTIPISTNKAYFLYLRGDRTVGVGSSTSTNTFTTLRSTGALYQGTQTSEQIPANSYGLIGNPFASAINFNALTRTGGVNNVFYIWDSKIQSGNTLGSYQTFSATNNFNCLMSGGSFTLATPNTTIQSGQAFFVETNGTAGSVSIPESSKLASSGTTGYKITSDLVKIDSRLYSIATSGTTMADANVVVFDSIYSNAVDGNDALKFSNGGENFGILRDGQTLVIEGRQPITSADTIFFRMWNMQPHGYQLEFAPQNLASPNITAKLEDSYLGTSTPIDLTITNQVNFTVNSTPASYASNRFRIVFAVSAVLPVNFLSIGAIRKASNALVSWKVGNEINLHHYEVEHSTDGRKFYLVGYVPASSASTYSFIDMNVPSSNLFYRIRSIGVAGDITISSVVKLGAEGIKSSFAVVPNPVEGGRMNIQFGNQQKGIYQWRLINETGQQLTNSEVSHPGGFGSFTVSLPNVAKGTYQLEIIAPDKTIFTQKVLVKNTF